MKNEPRLYIAEDRLSQGADIALNEQQVHYIRNVMRMEEGEGVRLFNGRDGEFRALIKELTKRSVTLLCGERLRDQVFVPDIHVLASPLKKENFDLMIEKASELGAKTFTPVICDNTVVHKTNLDKNRLHAIEAAEQCERLDIMEVNPLEKLKTFLAVWDKEVKIIACLERANAQPILQVVQGRVLPLAILIGPEGGFSDAEIKLLNSLEFVVPVSLGGRILRAETALFAGLSLIQAAVGDW